MITKIELTNFKSHVHTVIEPGRVTALVGPNGSGKTSILQAIYILNQCALKIIGDGFINWDHVEQFIRARQDKNDLGISIIGQPDDWGIEISGSKMWDSRKQHDLVKAAQSFGKVSYFKAIGGNISAPSYTLDIPPVIGIDGSDTASVISYLKNSQEEVHTKIEEDLKRIVPVIKRIRVRPVSKFIKEKRTLSANGNTLVYDEDKQVTAWELIFDTDGGDKLPASMISEGTLVTLALLTLLHTSNAGIFLIDDIEAGLHPFAQRQLMQTLINFAQTYDKQIIFTSHSPYIIDEIEAKDVWVMATDKEGISHTKRLSDHPDTQRALEVLTTGEIWDAEGESWVVDDQLEKVNA